MIRKLAGTSWGCNTADRRAVYVTYVQSAARYGCEVYMAWASDAAARKVESAQARGAKIISGCTSDTRNEIALREAKLMPLRQIAIGCAGVTYERLARLPADNPARAQVEMAEPPSKSTKRFTGSFRRVANQIVKEAGVAGRHKITNAVGTSHPTLAGWRGHQVPPRADRQKLKERSSRSQEGGCGGNTGKVATSVATSVH